METEAPTDDPTDEPTDPTSGVIGDPHFETWAGKWYDFHGVCDMVLLHDPAFAGGLGMNIHVRTSPRYQYSYVESAVVQIGEDILEVSSFGEHFFNGVDANGADHADFTLGGFAVHYDVLETNKKHFEINIDGSEKITITTLKDMVSVKIHSATSANFANSVGLMGSFGEGQFLARDGLTVLEDAQAFGQEWQVQASEPMLFQSVRAPQAADGQQCQVPQTITGLRGNKMTQESAAVACSHLAGEDKANCIADVIAFNDKEMAGAY